MVWLLQNAMMPSETQTVAPSGKIPARGSQQIIFYLLCLGFVLNGIIITFVGPMLTVLKAKWLLNDGQAGLFSLAQFAASLVGVLASSPLMSKKGFKPAIVAGIAMQGIGFADEVSDGDLKAITGAAGARLAMVPPVTITFGPPMVAGEGVTCWVSPARALDQVRDAVRAGIADVWGADRVPESPDWTAHVSVAYANADGPGATIDAALEGMGGTETTVRAVDLICLGRDNHVYEWETIASLSLG